MAESYTSPNKKDVIFDFSNTQQCFEAKQATKKMK
jgi:hypothetical protein